MESLKNKCIALFPNRGCFGCCAKPSTVIEVEQPPKGAINQNRAVRKDSLSDGFWSTSAGDMDNNSAFHSQGTLSSISTLNQPLDPYSDTASTNNPSEFVNHGLLLWNQTRQQWFGNRSSQKQIRSGESTIGPNANYEGLLGTNKPFPRPIPLAEMVDFLVDIWEQEGLYD